MALATVAAVIRELQIDKEDFGFTNQDEYETWITGYLNWFAAKVEEWVGSASYLASNLDLVDAEIFLTCSRMLSALYGSSAGDAEAGWAIGSLRINQSSIAQKGLREAAKEYFDKAMGKLSGYMTITPHRIEVLTPTETEAIIYPVDRFYLQQAED